MTQKLSIEDLQKQRRPIFNPFVEARKNQNALEKFAITITNRIGTMGFFFILLVWTILWLSWNIFAPDSLRFDPFPGFVLWLFISNLIQIFLLPLIMIGQNIQSKYAELLAEADYEVNKKAEIEIEQILIRLEHLQATVEQSK
jgi:uncharacterized membrane protein